MLANDSKDPDKGTAVVQSDDPKDPGIVRSDEYHKFIREAALKNMADFDRAITTLSASSLALTVTFIGNVVSDGDPDWKLAALVGWIFLTLAMVTSVSSHLMADLGYEAAEEGNYAAIDLWNKRLKWTNLTSGLLLTGGLLGLAVFAFANL